MVQNYGNRMCKQILENKDFLLKNGHFQGLGNPVAIYTFAYENLGNETDENRN